MISNSLRSLEKVASPKYSRVRLRNLKTGHIVRKKDTGKIYAMKTLSKQKIKRDNKVENILNERAILEKVQHPFIIQMKCAFQNVILNE